jgi:hypothetical protein
MDPTEAVMGGTWRVGSKIGAQAVAKAPPLLDLLGAMADWMQRATGPISTLIPSDQERAEFAAAAAQVQAFAATLSELLPATKLKAE